MSKTRKNLDRYKELHQRYIGKIAEYHNAYVLYELYNASYPRSVTVRRILREMTEINREMLKEITELRRRFRNPIAEKQRYAERKQKRAASNTQNDMASPRATGN